MDFYYDESSPSCLRWASARSNMKAGDVAGSLKPDGYWKVRNRGTPRGVHIVVWEMFNGPIGPREVDHIDGNPGNNKISNLRATDRAGQCRNAAIRKVWDRETTIRRLGEFGIEQATSTPADFATFIRAQIAFWGEQVRAAGIEPE